MAALQEELSATEFKAKCLQLLDRVAEGHATFIVTKHGKAVARLVPVSDVLPPLGGCDAESVTILGDLVDFDTSADWEVLGDGNR
jgi:prevent-host-death family protein